MRPVSSIAGAVLDENGEPIAGVAVQAIVVRASLSGTDYAPVQTAHTDELGHYALINLTPGDYLVRLFGESSATNYFQGPLNPVNDHRGMQPVYYPNSDSIASAMLFNLTPGSTATADFRQNTESAFDVNGQLSGFARQAWTRLRLYREGDRMPVGRAFVNLTTGQFRLTDIVRGSYTLRVEQYQADPPLWLAAEEPLHVIAQPIQNLSVQLTEAVDIPVSISYEAGSAGFSFVQLLLQPEHSPENLRMLPIAKRPNADRLEGDSKPDAGSPPPSAFTNVIPDKYKLIVQVSGHGAVYVASAKLGDLDVLHGEFQIGGSVPGELHVTVRGDSASVEGQVAFQGKPAMGAQIYLIATSSDGAAPKYGRSGSDGYFAIQGIPPGDYRIHAWMGSPAPKEIMMGSGEILTLQAGDHKTLTLEATPGEQK